MRSWIFHCIGGAAALASLALVVMWLASYRRTLDVEAKLHGAIVLSARRGGSDLRLVATRWGPESAEWWKTRSGLGPMTVTGQTVVISSGPTLYATRLNVDLGVTDWHGVQWRQGAVSRKPVTVSGGVMSTPLVPYRSVSVPWFYPLLVLVPVGALWVGAVVRRRRKRQSGHCVACGYDLRATPERCPECGSFQATTPRSPSAA